MNLNNKDTKIGFTIIELMLAMSFVSVLLIAIAMAVIQISDIYNKGITLKGSNQLGRSIISELKRGISNSAEFDVGGDKTANYVKLDWGGRLCMGQYSYIWNYGKDIIPGSTNYSDRNKYLSNNDKEIRFVKVYDSDMSYCKLNINNKYPDIKDEQADEFLSDNQYNLVVHKLLISSSDSGYDSKTGQRLYSVDMIIGTNDQLALKDSSTACKSPNESGSDIAYCAITEFNMTVRSGGGSSQQVGI
jgi:competence protein ComGC